MCKIARIEWTYRTAGAEVSQAPSQVRVEVFRDGELLTDLSDESHTTARLHRPDSTTRVVTFAAPPTAHEPTPAPAFQEFSDGVRGHLDVRFRVDGPDAWQIRAIESTVVLADVRPALGSLDASEWRESREHFEFEGVGVISADPCDATAILELSY